MLRSNTLVPKTKITLINESTKNELLISSSEEGTYEFSALEPGTYQLVFETLGFKKSTHTDIKIIASQEMRLDVLSILEQLLGDIVFIQDFKEILD